MSRLDDLARLMLAVLNDEQEPEDAPAKPRTCSCSRDDARETPTKSGAAQRLLSCDGITPFARGIFRGLVAPTCSCGCERGPFAVVRADGRDLTSALGGW